MHAPKGKIFFVDPKAITKVHVWEEYFQKLEANKEKVKNGRDGGVS
jgi:hypothetical protein